MGDWNTLHLFNDTVFYNETVPLLKGIKRNLNPYYFSYLTTCLGGKCDTPLDTMVDVFNQMDKSFQKFPPFEAMWDKDYRGFLAKYKWSYHLSAFFEQVVFADCADLLPNYCLGKRGLPYQLPDILTGGLGNAIVCELKSNGNNIFTAEGAGITGWITAEEAEELLSDIDQYLATKPAIHEDDIWYLEDFAAFLRIAVTLKMGILQGANLREDVLKRSPQYKLSTREIWDTQKIERLTFV